MNKRILPAAYYREQAGLWRKVLAQDPHNADAWYNYYRASYNAYLASGEVEFGVHQTDRRYAPLQQIRDSMAARVPDSYEFMHVHWMNSLGDVRSSHLLDIALEMEPGRPEPYLDWIHLYENMGMDSMRDASCTAYMDLNDHSPGLLNYGHNLLAGLAPNAILLTRGQMETQAVWLQQGALGFRTDVRILDLDMFAEGYYRNRLCGVLGIRDLQGRQLTSDTALAWYKKHVIALVAANRVGTYTAVAGGEPYLSWAERPVEVSLSVDGPYLSDIADALQLTGLTYRYDTTAFDPMPVVIANYESRYQLDPLHHPGKPDISAGDVDRLNAQYLPSLRVYCDHLARVGEVKKEERYRKLAAHLERRAQREAEFQRSYGR